MVHIITDSTSCMNADIAAHHNIAVIPQLISFGDESFYEGVDIDNEQFMSRLIASKELPKTAAPPPELFVKEFERLSTTEEPILCIHPSAEVSGTVRSASVASQAFQHLDIRVIDTRTAGSPLGRMVELAAGWVEAGLNPALIEQQIRERSVRCRVYFLVATLEYLAKGGRIGGASALLGSMLQIKPILTLNAGVVEVYERERTHRRALQRLIEIVCDQAPHTGKADLSIMHAGVPDRGSELAQLLSARIGQSSVPVFPLPPAITTHVGPGTLAAAFFLES